MSAIPFLIQDTYGGLAHCHGLVRDEGESLVIECRTQDSITGMIKSDVQETRIPLTEVASISTKKSWAGWSDRLIIQMASMKQVAHIPGMTQGRIILPITRANLPMAEDLVHSVSAYLHKSDVRKSADI